MTDHEQQKFEARLRQLKPGKLPEELVARIQADVSIVPKSSPTTSNRSPGFLQILRWLIPATAAIVVTAIVWHRQPNSSHELDLSNLNSQAGSVAAEPLKPDNVQIGKELVSSFDAVATLPGGEPVRFRCQQWVNTVVVDDEKRGLVMQSRTPRVIVVPVGFETY